MKSQLVLCVMIAGMSPLVGCQTNHSIVRGQTPAPAASPASGPMAPMPGPMYYNGPAGAPDNFWTPTHHHTYDYRQPKDLLYPPQNQPAAAVVYPYYTLKGPSDFFMK